MDQQVVPHRPQHGVLHVSYPEPHVPGLEIPPGVAPPPSTTTLVLMLVAGIVGAIVGFLLEHVAEGVPDAQVHPAWIAPFALLLAAIALMPFIARHWWEHNYARVAVALGAIVGGYYLFFVVHGRGNVARTIAEYISFIYLIGSLFIVSGGIYIRVRARATPLANAVLLQVGAVIANLVGTTGASMLLIRPFLRMNGNHLRAYHVVFFIFIVSNAGGSLTPIGDPPLFLGYLKGVPFFWVLEIAWPIWLLVVGLLVTVFFLIDVLHARGQERPHYRGDDIGPAVSLYGASNLLFVVLILFGVLAQPAINEFTGHHLGFEAPWRELLMVVASVGSLRVTPFRIHLHNQFNYAPIREVAFLFIGIFLTMLPALNYLYHRSAGSNERLLTTPGHFYFATGILSSFLDNAPTYLTFFKTELGMLDDEVTRRELVIANRDDHGLNGADVQGLDARQTQLLRDSVRTLMKYHAGEVATHRVNEEAARIAQVLSDRDLRRYLTAISMAAVLFGACTYIGNGPNFMVKSIAEHAGTKMPSFFGYILVYTLPVLLPILLLVWWVFLRG